MLDHCTRLPHYHVIARSEATWQSPAQKNETNTHQLTLNIQVLQCEFLFSRTSLLSRRFPEGELPHRGKRGHPGVRRPFGPPRNDILFRFCVSFKLQFIKLLPISYSEKGIKASVTCLFTNWGETLYNLFTQSRLFAV